MGEIFETLHTQPLSGSASGHGAGQGAALGAGQGAPQSAAQAPPDMQGDPLACSPFELPAAAPQTQALGDPVTQRVMEDFLSEHPSMSQVLRVGSLEGEGDALTNLMSVCAWRYSGSEIADEELADLAMSFFELCLRNRVELLAQS